MKEKYLYLIEFNGLIKIGFSINPETRLKQFNLGKKARILFKKQWPHIGKIEHVLHDLFEDKRYSGEYFDLTDEDIDYIKDFDLEQYSELTDYIDE